MKVFKFGGASLKNADAIRNAGRIVTSFAGQPLLIVVSAMGKTTNALEQVLHDFIHERDYHSRISELADYHHVIIRDLFDDPGPVLSEVNTYLQELGRTLVQDMPHDQLYDQVIAYGELLSSVIVSRYLAHINLPAQWLDARDYIITDDDYREGKVDWPATLEKIKTLKGHSSLLLTQGFIGRTPTGFTTTLGREGSDFSAAIFAFCLDADSVTIWKDVPGVMTADPKRLPDATVFTELPYREAAEMTYYGASVIHPKTIKPLANKGIPLYVKNFDDPSLPGTIIHECHVDHLPPLIVIKENQCLISCKVTDYSFINEQEIGTIFHALSELNIKVNVMQNSAISLSFCVDFRHDKISMLIKRLQQHFEVYYNASLALITIKNYDKKTFDHYRNMKGVLLEQSSRSTLQVLVRAQTIASSS